MSSTNKTTYYELSQYVGTDKPTYLGDYNSDMLAIDTAIHEAATDASTAVSTANTANATATTASGNATTALSTANSALDTANTASSTATKASTNASAALTAAENAETAASANTITNLAPAYDSTLTYAVGDLVSYIDEQGSGKLYKCIVSVSTPEAFNINKWDDITVSEKLRPTTLSTVNNTVGTKTFSEMFDEIFTILNSLPTTDCLKVFIKDENEQFFKFDRCFVDSSTGDVTQYSFSNIFEVNNALTVAALRIRSTSSTFKTIAITSANTTFEDYSSNTAPTTRVYTIIQM